MPTYFAILADGVTLSGNRRRPALYGKLIA